MLKEIDHLCRLAARGPALVRTQKRLQILEVGSTASARSFDSIWFSSPSLHAGTPLGWNLPPSAQPPGPDRSFKKCWSNDDGRACSSCGNERLSKVLEGSQIHVIPPLMPQGIPPVQSDIHAWMAVIPPAPKLSPTDPRTRTRPPHSCMQTSQKANSFPSASYRACHVLTAVVTSSLHDSPNTGVAHLDG